MKKSSILICILIGIFVVMFFVLIFQPGFEREQELNTGISDEDISEDIIKDAEERSRELEGQESQTPSITQNIRIANWNIEVFGDEKASNKGLMNTYSSIIDDYDIVFIQEIRDPEQTAFPKLCALLPNYDCNVSSLAGRTSVKEQYGIIYNKSIKIKDFKDFNPDAQDRWERPPIEVTFDIDGYKLIVYNIHIKAGDAPLEIDYLEDVVKTQGNVMVLGDLNADCAYYSRLDEGDFILASWNWAISDYDDTTVSSFTDCAYDRILLNDDVYWEYQSDGIYKEITPDMSDHYLVWVEIKI